MFRTDWVKIKLMKSKGQRTTCLNMARGRGTVTPNYLKPGANRS